MNFEFPLSGNCQGSGVPDLSSIDRGLRLVVATWPTLDEQHRAEVIARLRTE